MVIVRPFPNMPLGFWGDDDGSRYKAAYFEECSLPFLFLQGARLTAFTDPKTPVWYQGDVRSCS